jgi:hypothetical protein
MLATIAGQEVPLGGDIVLRVQDIAFSPANVPRIREALSRLSPGQPFTVTILRSGDVLELTGRAR